ncbi:very short patch repair endonuclease [Paenibacillus lignilyticus]|uniref:Very short patch repair endonuclease n=1 Tax=Paenibacillus lignilyticus TaxID=1172615 RepID=A0ABS5CK48_9BACL|nr:very short patch repair endonuclease [Paenibacillus lignilyticus]MBP3966246.1 very short patch repair endonuclease [Paenibacillus lignilyticus]
MIKTSEQISYNMKQVKHKDSKIELLLRKELWRRGLRYRKNISGIIGKPDIAFPGLKIAIFCDSEFWHGYNWGDDKKKEFKSNAEFWIKKIEGNMQRDIIVNNTLAELGWTVIRFWGKEIKQNFKQCADIIEQTVIRVRSAMTKEKNI